MSTNGTTSEKERYQAYLAGREWNLLKQQVKARSGGICERCKINPSDAVHHLTYERKYHERLEDLQDICEACHRYTHGLSHEDPIEEQRKDLLIEFATHLFHAAKLHDKPHPHPWLFRFLWWIQSRAFVGFGLKCFACSSTTGLIVTYPTHGQVYPTIWCSQCLCQALNDYLAPDPPEEPLSIQTPV